MNSLKFTGSEDNITIVVAAKPGNEACFWSVRYWKVRMPCKNALGPRIVSAVWSLEVVASRRLPMYYKNGIFNP